MSEAIKHNILFVDDDSDFLATLRDLYEMMSEHSWQIFTATSANKALEALDAERIDLVVVDVNMPVIDGIQFMGILQRRHRAGQWRGFVHRESHLAGRLQIHLRDVWRTAAMAAT